LLRNLPWLQKPQRLRWATARNSTKQVLWYLL
jgi:hypothetical protein